MQLWTDKAKSLKLDYDIEKHQLNAKNTNGQVQSKTNAIVQKKDTHVGDKRNHAEMTQTQKDNDLSSITSYSGDEDAEVQNHMLNGKKQKKAENNDDDSSDL